MPGRRGHAGMPYSRLRTASRSWMSCSARSSTVGGHDQAYLDELSEDRLRLIGGDVERHLQAGRRVLLGDEVDDRLER
jgi:hypothetical protein